MYCNQCGKVNPDEAIFCSSCGKQITHPAEQRNTSVPGNCSGSSSPRPSSSLVTDKPGSASVQRPRWVWPVVVGAIILLGGVLTVFFLSGKLSEVKIFQKDAIINFKNVCEKYIEITEKRNDILDYEDLQKIAKDHNLKYGARVVFSAWTYTKNNNYYLETEYSYPCEPNEVKNNHSVILTGFNAELIGKYTKEDVLKLGEYVSQKMNLQLETSYLDPIEQNHPILFYEKKDFINYRGVPIYTIKFRLILHDNGHIYVEYHLPPFIPTEFIE